MTNRNIHLLTDERLQTEIFVPPSDEACALMRLWPGLVSLSPDESAPLRRAARDFLVAPYTQLTFLSFDLQAFLFEVFHTTWTAQVGHLLGMVGVNLFLMAALTALWAPLGWVYVCALLCWYAAVTADARLPLWWFATVPVVVGLKLLSDGWLAATVGLSGPWASPWLWMLISAAVVSFSHGTEPLFPPRAGDPLRWMPVPEFVFGARDQRNPPTVALRRALRVGIYPFIGTIDELWASPRLLAYNILFLMFRVGYAPARRAELLSRVRRALDSGNPAIDFVGIGGGAVLAPGSAPS